MIASIDRWSVLHRAARVVALAVTVSASGTTLAVAQQGQQPTTTPPGPATQNAQGDYSAWVKICTNEPTKNQRVCLVKYEGLDPKTGSVLVTAVVRTTEGEDKPDLIIGVPSAHTLVMPAGVQIKIDEGEPIQMQYKLCIKQTCQVQGQLAQQVLDTMRKGERMLVVALDIQQKPVVFKVPLDGFTKTFDGAPVDEAKYDETKLRMIEFARKTAKEQQKQGPPGQSQASPAGAQPNAPLAPPKMPSAPAPQ